MLSVNANHSFPLLFVLLLVVYRLHELQCVTSLIWWFGQGNVYLPVISELAYQHHNFGRT